MNPVLPWQFEPVPMAGLFNLTLLYVLGIGPLRLRYFPGKPFPFPTGKVLVFMTGMLLFFLILASPLHILAEVYLVSAHMLQLSLLIYVVAPLLLLGTPGWLLEPVIRPIQPLLRSLTRPVVAFIVFSLSFTLWHLPAVFREILRNEVLHGVSYIVILAAALLMWWPILSPVKTVPRASDKTQLLYLLALLAAHLPWSLVIMLLETPLYPWYVAAPRVWGLDPITDQQAGGMVMGAITLVALLIPLSAAALRWLAEVDKPREELRQA